MDTAIIGLDCMEEKTEQCFVGTDCKYSFSRDVNIKLREGWEVNLYCSS